MQVDFNLQGDPYRNLWAAVVTTALDCLALPYVMVPKTQTQLTHKRDRDKAVWFFSAPHESNLGWISDKLGIDLESIIKCAHEICPEVKIWNL